MRILVTGAGGFIGSHVAAAAQACGHTVRGTSRRGGAPGLDMVHHDLTDAPGIDALLIGIDAVVHCAASMANDAVRQESETLLATRNLVAAAERSGVTTFVLVSSLAVYDYVRVPRHGSLTEASPLVDRRTANPYQAAKLEQEAIVRDAASRRGWRLAILRPGLVYGPGRTWFHHLGIRARPGLWLVTGPGALLPLCHIENCAAAAVLALDAAPAAGVTVNLVDDDPPRRGEYVDVLAERARPVPVVVGLPWPLLSSAAAVGAVVRRVVPANLPDLLDPSALAARCKPLHYPNTLARTTLGWHPQQRFPDALRQALDS